MVSFWENHRLGFCLAGQGYPEKMERKFRDEDGCGQTIRRGIRQREILQRTIGDHRTTLKYDLEPERNSNRNRPEVVETDDRFDQGMPHTIEDKIIVGFSEYDS